MTDNSRAALVTTHSTYLLHYARRLTRREADAHDLVQDTWVQAFEAFERTDDEPKNVRGWLLVVMRNHWLNVVRHRRVCENGKHMLTILTGADPVAAESRVVCRKIERAWNALPEQARTIASRHLLEGLPQEIVARHLGMTAGGIAASIHRTRKHLRQVAYGA
jgi:RNA polymerase sigma-70 factor (ECF subfamily)